MCNGHSYIWACCFINAVCVPSLLLYCPYSLRVTEKSIPCALATGDFSESESAAEEKQGDVPRCRSM